MAKPPRKPMPFDPTVPFTRADARAAGLRIAELCGPKFHRIFYDLYISASVRITSLLRAQAALKISPDGSYASHFTAAEVWGGCVPEQPLTHVSVPAARSRSERRGIHGHVANASAETVTFRGIQISSPSQTFLDLAGIVDLVDLVVLGDSLVKANRTTPGELMAHADAWTGHGARLARRAARLVRKDVDSPMESRLRMLIVLAGLPEPQVNLILRNQNGDWSMRFDLSYPALKIIIEYDGRQHAEDDDQWDHDLDRREDLDRLGWRLIVVRSKGIFVEPRRTVARIVAVLRERGMIVRPRLDGEWSRYFPGRARAA